MSRLDIKNPSHAQTVVDNLYRDMERRIASSPPGLCPVDMALSFLVMSHAQTCGKCVPCRIGLGQLTKLITNVLDGNATMETLSGRNLVRSTSMVRESVMPAADTSLMMMEETWAITALEPEMVTVSGTTEDPT